MRSKTRTFNSKKRAHGAASFGKTGLQKSGDRIL